MDPALHELIKHSPEASEAEVILKLRDPARPPPQVRVIARFGSIVTARVPAAQLAETWAEEDVVSLKAPRRVLPEPVHPGDEAWEPGAEAWPPEGAARSETDFSGKGVLVATLDWGCDFTHPNFRNEDGSTRLLALWDQGAEPDPRRPNRYGYGVVHTREDINRALAAPDPFEALGYHPGLSDPAGVGSHGAHTLDIAAGNGRAPGSSRGVAPGATVAFVHLAYGRVLGTADLGQCSRLLEGLDFVARLAGDNALPWVANMSLGAQGGSHEGTTLVEQAMDALLEEAPGRAIVQSCGNYFSNRTHAHGRVAPRQKVTLGWRTFPADRTPNELEVWYARGDRFVVELTSPDGSPGGRVALGERASIVLRGREVGRLYHRAEDPNNRDHHIDLFLDPGAPAGRWQVTLIGEDVVDGRFNAWIERDPGPRGTQSCFDPDCATPLSTTNTLCNGYRTLAVGAYDPLHPERRPAPFSSSGPTRNGRQKPDLLAPGVRILAARSTPWGEAPGSAPLLTRKSGTSMAAPHVTGAVALMFEAARRRLTIQETRALLLASVERCPADDDEARTGYGWLDIDAAVAAAAALGAEAPSAPAAEPRAGGAAEQVAAEQEALAAREASPDVEALDATGDSGMEQGEAQEEDAGVPVPEDAGRAPEVPLHALLPEEATSWSEREALRAAPELLHPAVVFEAVVHGKRPGPGLYSRYFDVVARPGELLQAGVREGDVLLRRAPAEAGGGSATLLAPGQPPDTRWLTGEVGRLGPDQLVIRLREGARERLKAMLQEARIAQEAPPAVALRSEREHVSASAQDLVGGLPAAAQRGAPAASVPLRAWPSLLPRADRSQGREATAELATVKNQPPRLLNAEAPPRSPLTPELEALVQQVRQNRESLRADAERRFSLWLFSGKDGARYGYYYGGRPASPGDPLPATIASLEPLDQKVMALAWREILSEGGYGAINAYDSQLVTWGRGFGARSGQLGKILDRVFAIDEFRDAFLPYGIDYDRGSHQFLVVNGRTGAVEEGLSALAFLQADKVLLEVLARVGDDPKLGPHFADGQVHQLAHGPGVGIVDHMPPRMKAWVERPEAAPVLALCIHLNHSGPDYGWSRHPREYSDTEGRVGEVIRLWGRLIAGAPEAQTGALLISASNLTMGQFQAWGSAVAAREVKSVCPLPLPFARKYLSEAQSEEEQLRKRRDFGGKLFILAPGGPGAGFYAYPELPIPAGDAGLAEARRLGTVGEYAFFYVLNGLSFGPMVDGLLGLHGTRSVLAASGIPALPALRERFRQHVARWFGAERIELAFRVALGLLDPKGKRVPVPPALREELLQEARQLFGASDPQFHEAQARLVAVPGKAAK